MSDSAKGKSDNKGTAKREPIKSALPKHSGEKAKKFFQNLKNAFKDFAEHQKHLREERKARKNNNSEKVKEHSEKAKAAKEKAVKHLEKNKDSAPTENLKVIESKLDSYNETNDNKHLQSAKKDLESEEISNYHNTFEPSSLIKIFVVFLIVWGVAKIIS